MIGSFVSAYFIGKKPVTQALIFWGALLIIGWILGAYAFGQGGIMGMLVNMIVGIIIFILFAIFYLRVNLFTSIIMYLVALVINVVIGLISGVAYGLANFTLEMLSYGV